MVCWFKQQMAIKPRYNCHFHPFCCLSIKNNINVAKKNNITLWTVSFVSQTPYTSVLLLCLCQIRVNCCLSAGVATVCTQQGNQLAGFFYVECIQSLRFIMYYHFTQKFARRSQQKKQLFTLCVSSTCHARKTKLKNERLFFIIIVQFPA